MTNSKVNSDGYTTLPHSKSEVLRDYGLAFLSRQASLVGRKEVLTGKAKFGIFGDGKELPQIAMAKAFEKGDWRSGYYRDQTFMLAVGAVTLKQYFAQLYADADLTREPHSVGRQMNNHFATRYMSPNGDWLDQTAMYNSVADASPTASQMPRLVGLGYASKLYRQVDVLQGKNKFSNNGREIGFGTIGDASTSEGLFWESLNACGVLQVPVLISVWDDEFGISVPKSYQTTKSSISEIVSGFQKKEGDSTGFDIYKVRAWNYPELLETYTKAAQKIRETHTPALIHVIECTQPQGHSTSGSHERYKSSDRLKWEKDNDCLDKMREWILAENIANADELHNIEQEMIENVKSAQHEAWDEYLNPIENERKDCLKMYEMLSSKYKCEEVLGPIALKLKKIPSIHRRDIHASARRAILDLKYQGIHASELIQFETQLREGNNRLYSDFQFCNDSKSPLRIESVPLRSEEKQKIEGFQIINECFDMNLKKYPELFIIGEDVGKLGGVNQGFKDLNQKYGELRVTDTGIREATILGQGIGAAVRGLRPVVDIQYLDYLLYCFQTLSDDLATLQYRSAGGQAAPVIIRSKGHRLEGIWHTGSPIGMILNGIRGIHVCVPRNMTQAAGLYNTILEGNDPALVIEVLNGYRVKEPQPLNLSEFRVALGEVEILNEGQDLTVVTYGACVKVATEAMSYLETLDISIELIDAQTLLPFDRKNQILESIQKTNAVIFFDEDVPGGASAYMMQQVLENGHAYQWLDAKPRTLTAKPHRSAYGSDGDYYSKPSAEDLIELVCEMLYERNPQKYSHLK